MRPILASVLVLALAREAYAFGNQAASGNASADRVPRITTSAIKTNEWVVAPSLSQTAWREGRKPAEVNVGKPLNGESTVTYSNRLDAAAAVTTEMPTAQGEYTAWFEVPVTPYWTGLSKAIDFSIVARPEVGNGQNYHSIYDYASRAVLTVKGYTAGATGYNFPMLVRISQNSPSGFTYSGLRNGQKGLRFFDSEGRSLEYEVASWNERGTSTIWVCVPTMRNGETITMCWNLLDGYSLPELKGAASVWADYVGVWHMDESITAATAPTTDSADATGHGLDAKPSCVVVDGMAQGNLSQMISTAGVFGNARINAPQGSDYAGGNRLEVPSYDKYGAGGRFTLSAWVKFFDRKNDNRWPNLFSRKEGTQVGAGWNVEWRIADKSHLTVRGANNTAVNVKAFASDPSNNASFFHLVVVYDNDKATLYCRKVGDTTTYTGSGTIEAAVANGLPLLIGSCRESTVTKPSFNGVFDEVRLSPDVKDAAWVAAEYAQSKTGFYTAGAVTNETGVVLKNSWVRKPSATRTTWEVGGAVPTIDDFDLGQPAHGLPRITFYNRATGAVLGEDVPTGVGDYRAVVTVDPTYAEGTDWGGLQETIDFRIIRRDSTHAFGYNVDRILLMNDDYSVDGGTVEWQSYDDEDGSDGQPYWQHLDADGNDVSSTYEPYWSTSLAFNLGGGSHHVYSKGAARLWDLRDVRVGNTFHNGEDLDDRGLPWEEFDQGLEPNQNYLCWNPASQRVLNAGMETVEGWHRFASQAVMQNSLDAAISSSCYTNGIGTIYFDAVNGWTDNVTNGLGEANYRLAVQIATNTDYSADAPYDHLVDSVVSNDLYDAEGVVTGQVAVLRKAAKYADWRTVPVRVLRFDGDQCEDLGESDSVVLDVEQGGSYRRFYRIIAPVQCFGPVRFRIVRTAIDETQKFSPDGTAYILVDNVICSTPTDYVTMEPYGRFVSAKAGKQVLGQEAAFETAFPSMTDAGVRGRAKARMASGCPIPSGTITAATMHYRWHYIEQKTTDWLVADLDPAQFVTQRPLELPGFEGDVDFWFDLNQIGSFYEYADYSGTGLGLGTSGYTEEITSVTNRQNAALGDWFVRIREGKSNYPEMKLVVKTSEKGRAAEYDLSMVGDRLWRGHYKMTEALPEGIWWRIEPRDEQADGATAWSSNTNYWYVANWTDEMPTFPAAGRMLIGDTNSWSRMPCDKQTGYLTFQLDESALGLTVTHSDYQNFNDWNDAAKGYFTGSSTETNKMRGTSSTVLTFKEEYKNWTNTPGTNANWSAIFDGRIGGTQFGPGYVLFDTDTFQQWNLANGMWIHKQYKEVASYVAFQMMGAGQGYMEFADKSQLGNALWPRGIETLSFNARIAQDVELDRFAYYGPGWNLTNYTFLAYTCFDTQGNKGFAGNASVSLLAYFRDGFGGYEARWEQVAGDTETTTGHVGEYLGPKADGQQLVLYRWDVDPDGDLYVKTQLQLGSCGRAMPTMSSSSGNNYLPMFISAYEDVAADGKVDTVVVTGVRIKGSGTTSSPTTSGIARDTRVTEDSSGDYWYFLAYRDRSANRKTGGTYGVLSANCPGSFYRPQYRPAPTWPTYKADASKEIGTNRSAVVTGAYAFNSSNKLNDYSVFTNCVVDIANGNWSYKRDREQPFYNARQLSLLNYGNFGFKYAVPNQTVEIYTAEMSDESTQPTGAWEHKGSIKITGFGSPDLKADYRTNLYERANVAVRLKAGGKKGGFRTDVAISDVVFSQLRGSDDWSTSNRDWDWNGDLPKSPNYNDYGYTNVLFTAGWVTNGAVRLSAKRTQEDWASSIRSPLFDGYDERRIGLGMIGFTYREPQRNVRLKVQMTTNYTYRTDALNKMSRRVTEGDGNETWTTVQTLDYATLMLNFNRTTGRGEWKSDCFGYHGSRGMMRIVIDSDLVKEVATVTDPNNFGEIDILSAWCKDEPSLDKGCWWGWNLQTAGDFYDTQKRMYLPDYALTDPSQCGQSLALNNSVTDGVNPKEDRDDFKKHMPFLQSPTFTNSVIGQLSFKARKYDLSDRAPAAKVAIYGATRNPDLMAHDNDPGWVFIEYFDITNTVYETYSCKTDTKSFYAIRIGVVDVPGTAYPPNLPPKGAAAQRVMLDEVSVSEAVRATLAFRNVGAFRRHLNDTTYVIGATTKEEQPLCDENWGIQAEIFATMLGNEIDKDFPPRVKLHWYVGKEPWGYEKWRDIETGSAYLASTDASNYVYRSSYPAAPAAVMQAQSTAGTVVQYMLEVEYQTVNTTKGETTHPRATNWLDSAAWSAPKWFAPVDYNADPGYGAGETFAAFTILDKIAPGWAWVNEANISARTTTDENPDEKFQYVEICVPAEADISDWKIRMLELKSLYGSAVRTNDVATFGSTAFDQATGMKKDNLGMEQLKVFRLLGNKESDKLRKDNGTLDGIWQFSEASSNFRKIDGVWCIYDLEVPFGIQLVRPTGVIESSVVIVGTNRWGRLLPEYSPSNIVEKLNKNVPGSRFFFTGEDCCGAGRSLSVTASCGESPSVWTNTWACSPGYVNSNFTGQVQILDPDHPRPQGDSIIIYAQVDTTTGPIRQLVGGDPTLTNRTEMIILTRGSARGTNIVYEIAPWYELKSIATNKVPIWAYQPHTTLRYELKELGKGASNNFTVVASAQIDSKLRDYGLTDSNPYTPAVMDWLLNGKDAYGNDFANKDAGEIALAHYLDMMDADIGEMGLTQMYWLDMDPTASNLFLKGYITRPTTETKVGGSYDGLNNVKTTLFMMISNGNERVVGERVWSPYILRGLDPKFTSWDYADAPAYSQSWTSETFKVTGILANGMTSRFNKDNWIPLRWFVFNKDSFYQPGDTGHKPFTSDIEIIDPKSKSSPAAGPDAGWYDWFKDPAHADTPIYFWWYIDERLKPVGVEVLKKQNHYE